MRHLLVLLAAACSTLPPPPPRESIGPEEAFHRRWAGADEDDVVVHFGKPQNILALSSGNYVDEYHHESAVSTARSSGSASSLLALQSARADSRTLYCDIRFEIDKTTHRVVRAIMKGDNCDFNQ